MSHIGIAGASCLVRVLLWHTGLRWHPWVSAALLLLVLLGNIVLVREDLLCVDWHVVWMHWRSLHAWSGLLRREMLRSRFFWSFDGVLILDAVFVVAGWLGGI